jgi:outer membrane protein TolC
LPAPAPCDKPLPINLPTALQLANVKPLDIAIASERIRLAVAQLERAEVLWLPTIYLGTDYFRHDGQIQDVAGNVFGTSKSTFMVGGAPFAVFALSDAIFAPLAARQEVRAQDALRQTVMNDTLLSVAEAYFTVQQARGELAGAEDAVRRAEQLLRVVEKLAPGVIPQVEVVRVRTELARRRNVVHGVRERWRVVSADLARILRLDASALVVPLEPPQLQVTLVKLDTPIDNLIPLALHNRPELAAQQALVEATLERLRQEKLRPLIPSVLLRGASTNPAGTLAGGVFGGGINADLSNFSARSDFDIQVVWEFQNLGFGNHARVKERHAENQVTILDLFRIQDRIAAEVTQAYNQVQSAAARMHEAEAELKDAIDSVEKNVSGLNQPKRLGGEVIQFVIRPQEVVAAIQSLGQAYNDYFGAVADYDRAQFRLYRALGHPAQALTSGEIGCQTPVTGSTLPEAPPH